MDFISDLASQSWWPLIKFLPPPDCVRLCPLPGTNRRGLALCMGGQYIWTTGHRQQEQPAEPSSDHDWEREVSDSISVGTTSLDAALLSPLVSSTGLWRSLPVTPRTHQLQRHKVVRCTCGASAGASLLYCPTSHTLPALTMSLHALPPPQWCGGFFPWVRPTAHSSLFESLRQCFIHLIPWLDVWVSVFSLQNMTTSWPWLSL